MKKTKTIKSFLLQLKYIAEQIIISELKGSDKLTEEEAMFLHGIIASVQNEMGEMNQELYDKYNVKRYDGSQKKYYNIE